MKMHWWIDYKNQRKIVIFCALTIAALIFCFYLPSRAWQIEINSTTGNSIPTPAPLDMLVTWIGGWFIVFFLKIEDLQTSTPFDYQGASRILAGALIIIGFAIGTYLYFQYRT